MPGLPLLHAGTNDASDDNSRSPLLKKTASHTNSFINKISLLLSDWFLWELISILVAILSLIIIVTILAIYDSSSLPDWPSVITINSVISLFSTISKLSVSAVIGACISQSKWLWYKRKPRRLQDVQMFDGASRGPWGAVALLLAVKAKSPASIGAALVVLVLLFDPFIQQVVTYPDRLVPSDKPASITRARRYKAHSYEGLPLPSVLDLSMKAAIYSGIFDVSNKAGTNPEHFCPSGNCTWDDYSSLAVCSKCVNITSYIEKSCNKTSCYAYSLPQGPSTFGLGGQINSSESKVSSDLDELTPSVLRFASLISRAASKSDDASAWECVLTYCVNVYSSVVHNGDFGESVRRSWMNNSASLSQGSDLIYRPPTSVTNMTGNQSEFRVVNLAAQAMNRFMSETFTGSGGFNSSHSGPAFSSDVIQALYTTDNYSSTILNLAKSMTTNIRRQNDSNFEPLKGDAYQGETYVHVRWAWFAYPTAIIALSLLLLTGVIFENMDGEVRVWGASNIALLFHGQGLPLDDVGSGPSNTISQMTAKAKAVTVHLIKEGNEEWKLVEAR